MSTHLHTKQISYVYAFPNMLLAGKASYSPKLNPTFTTNLPMMYGVGARRTSDSPRGQSGM